MKILHTADWHIGKKLHQHELAEDISLFLEWLTELIKQENVDVLLVSGDIFDLANPSNDAKQQYYRALQKLTNLHCKVILTGGNHDSPSLLNAPKELLNILNIEVIGEICDYKDMIIPIAEHGKTKLLIAAIPFLRDADLRKANEGNTYEDRIEIVQNGIANVYKQASDYCQTNFSNIPVLAMGHLFTAGATTSESERDIQIGNQAMFHSSRFGDTFSYVALGHIHKPQIVNSQSNIYYSGSPIPLSFSERTDKKRVLLIDTEKGFQPRSISVPVFRKLIRISGTLNEISQKLNNLPEPDKLTGFIEIHLTEEINNAAIVDELEQLITAFNKPGYAIVHRTIEFNQSISGTGELYNHNQQLSELSPQEVFEKKIENSKYEPETRDQLRQAFQIVLEEVQQSENA